MATPLPRKPYTTDLSDAQWAVPEPLIPPAKAGGRPRTVNPREVVSTLFYQARTGCQGELLPHDLLPKSTAHDYVLAWHRDGTWQRLVDAPRGAIRVAEGRDATPSAACADSQTVKTTERGGAAGYDGGKRIKGRKRHLVVDPLGLPLAVAVTAANPDDGTRAPRVSRQLGRARYPRLEVVHADTKYRNRTLDRWLGQTGAAYRVEVSSTGKDEKGFVPIRPRWRVGRGIACLNRCRRLSKDYEYTPPASETRVRIAAIRRMARRLRPDPDNGRAVFKYPKKHGEVA